jgi:hypothetical protein
VIVTLLQWHRLAAKAQGLARSALEMLRHPGSTAKATADAQSMMDHLARMGFTPSETPSTRSAHDGKG